jgi:peptidoglycan/xylan/chitin deacetylase (PgdA/CDA1 family)
MKCKKPMTIAMTFDDGPSENTQQLLDILGHHGAKATFFISGNTNGKGPIDQLDKWVQAIRRMDAEGHQLGSHTWDHSHMDKISSNARREELLKNERALANIVGKYPTYMRSPYVECGEECMADMKALGYHVVGWEVDSTDWQNERDLGAMTRVVDAAFDKAPADGNMLLIQHDTLPISAFELTKHVLKRVEEKGWKGMHIHMLAFAITNHFTAVTLSECLGEPKELDHRYPDVFDASVISHGGCAVSSGAGCLELESFYDKVTCFSTLKGCVKQLDSPVWQVRQASLDYAKAKAVCDKLYYFCAQCGEDSVEQASKCETKSFHFPQW